MKHRRVSRLCSDLIRHSADFQMAYLFRSEVRGQVERRRSGVRENECRKISRTQQ
ncbi:hypothetical protein RB5976 [Rhodopirellula baltica SH 1]|uniref:Uncharacterized protein n=1 Tax=Rhodopirellula baltica (strain DSM 10527 / NCIMB 13988 / SH1) TaxID=243090 RepID=Q7UR01_RHOBA|nr:hypothetical protein RB5976 [Rhodopirellula baltica SH 1]